MKKALALFGAAVCAAIWIMWPHSATQVQKTTSEVVTPVVAPLATVHARHQKAGQDVTEAALNKLGLTRKNSFGVSVKK